MERFGIGPALPPEDLQMDMEQLLMDPTLPDELAQPQVVIRPHPVLQKEASRVYKQAKAHYDSMREQFVATAKLHMDASIGVVSPILQQALDTGNLTLYWQCLWRAIEGSILAFTGRLHDRQAQLCRGRGEQPVNYMQVKLPRASEQQNDYSLQSPAWLATITNHANRCRYVADNLAILAKKKLDDAKKNDILAKIQDCKALIRPFLIYQNANPDQWYCPGEAEGAAVDSPAPGAGQHIQFNPANLLEKLDALGLGPFALHFALKKEITRYNSFIGAWQSHFSRQQEKEAASQLNKMQRSMGAMCKTLKGASSGPITRLRCCSEKGEGDIITTDPETIDKQLQAIWGKIHKGNLGPKSKELAGPAFLQAYRDHFVMQGEFSVERLNAQTLAAAILETAENAPGLDGVTAADLQLLSPVAIQKLADMLQAIEDGADWPDQTLAGRTAWLDKTEGPEASLDPLDFRGLAILSKVYRLYGSIRLRHLHDWIRSWEKEELFAGTTAPCGAEDAWYLMGVDMELARLSDQPLTGGSADIWKCFDQVQRCLLYFLLEAAGFPKPILRAYKNFHERVHYHNTIGKALGAPHRKPCSIPQGCPLSMMMTSFSFHPWVALMKAMNVSPEAWLMILLWLPTAQTTSAGSGMPMLRPWLISSSWGRSPRPPNASLSAPALTQDSGWTSTTGRCCRRG